MTRPIDDALLALQQVDSPHASAARARLGEGELALFDAAWKLRTDLHTLNERVLRSAQFAEATLGTAAFIHELRQCLAPLIGFADLMQSKPESPLMMDWAAEVANQGKRLSTLIDRHADLLRRPSEELGACDVSAIIEESVAYFTKLPPGVKLTRAIPEGLPLVRCNPRRLLHALINLIANARDAHTGKPGSIQVQARSTSASVEVLICDQGSGVEASARPHLFEPLFTTKGELGTGLGLYLTRELLRPQGEVILLEPEHVPAGYKTSFLVRMPLSST